MKQSELRKFIKATIREVLSEGLDDSVNQLKNIARDLSGKLHCDRHGSCVHFAELFVELVHDKNPELLNSFYVVEGYVDWEHGDDIPQQHTWIELLDGEKIDPTFEQFTASGWANYMERKKKKTYSGLQYYEDGKSGTWFSDMRKEYPERYYK